MPTQGPSSIPVTINIPVPQTVTDKPKQPQPTPAQPVAQTAPAPSVPPVSSSQNPAVMAGDVQPPITALILPWTPSVGPDTDSDMDMSMMDQPSGGLTPGTRSGVPTKPRPYLKSRVSRRRIVVD